MGLFTSNTINQQALVNEGGEVVWEINLSNDTLIELYIGRVDGYGPTVYVIPIDEWKNYQKGFAFKYMSAFHFSDIETFGVTEYLSRGRYKVVVCLPHQPDGWASQSVFNVRFEPVQ